MKTEVYALPELDCPNCAMKVERQVGRIKGLNEVTVDFVHKKMIVEFEGESRKEQIIQAVKKVEPDIRIVEVTDKKKRRRTVRCRLKVRNMNITTNIVTAVKTTSIIMERKNAAVVMITNITTNIVTAAKTANIIMEKRNAAVVTIMKPCRKSIIRQ